MNVLALKEYRQLWNPSLVLNIGFGEISDLRRSLRRSPRTSYVPGAFENCIKLSGSEKPRVEHAKRWVGLLSTNILIDLYLEIHAKTFNKFSIRTVPDFQKQLRAPFRRVQFVLAYSSFHANLESTLCNTAVFGSCFGILANYWESLSSHLALIKPAPIRHKITAGKTRMSLPQGRKGINRVDGSCAMTLLKTRHSSTCQV